MFWGLGGLCFNRPPVVVNTEKVEKGQSIMDALLGMFKVNAESKKGNCNF